MVCGDLCSWRAGSLCSWSCGRAGLSSRFRMIWMCADGWCRLPANGEEEEEFMAFLACSGAGLPAEHVRLRLWGGEGGVC